MEQFVYFHRSLILILTNFTKYLLTEKYFKLGNESLGVHYSILSSFSCVFENCYNKV